MPCLVPARRHQRGRNRCKSEPQGTHSQQAGVEGKQQVVLVTEIGCSVTLMTLYCISEIEQNAQRKIWKKKNISLVIFLKSLAVTNKERKPPPDKICDLITAS